MSEAPQDGSIFSLVDYAFACASNSHGQTAVGISVNMSYLASSQVGDELICTTTETKRTRKHSESDLKGARNNDDEKIFRE